MALGSTAVTAILVYLEW